MLHSRLLGVMPVVAALLALPAAAQQSAATATDATTPSTPPAETTPSTPAPPAPTPAQTPSPSAAAPSGNLPGVVATTNNPNLAVAAVKLENGVRASKLIGTAVRGDGDQEIGKLDDLIMTEGNKVTVAVVSVGGFLGLGSKLVAFPFSQFKMDPQHIVLPGATKDTLNAMPNFQY